MDRTVPSPESSMIGRRIGAYRLDEEIGRGGMGAVYRAARVDGEFDQTVAIKLIKRGMDTDMILRRFRRERQILASLNHPNIAYFLGGGSTEDGLPYFVMEHIEGLPLYRYCGHYRLNVRERLAVFRQVCWAVAAAHEIRVVHRDLKPSNIMVKEDGKPKLLDFGIAKVLDPEAGSTDADLTATQMRAMTPEYASPEQVSGEEIGPSSDIYSLGVILYELLTGHRPYTIRRRLPEEVSRLIREEVPTNPSSAITAADGLVPENGGDMSVEKLLHSRNTTAEDLRRQLAGDLDKIVMKSLRKEAENRYRSAMELADDITNYLEGRPVRAELFVTRTSMTGLKRPGSLSIAILPFKVISDARAGGDTGSEFVGIGLADALITRLSGLPRLIVRPTTSVLPFQNSTAFEASQQLGVDHVLDGNVRIISGRIRVSVQLYSAAADSTEWAKVFDKKLGDVLELEDSLAEQVAASLLPMISPEERDRLGRRGTNSPQAYEAYIRGRYFWSRFNNEDLLRAISEFERAIEIDPTYPYPYIGLADFYIWSAIFGEIPSTEAFPKVQEAARKALEINDTLGEAYAVLAWAVFLYEWNWSDAEFLLKRALELNPNNPLAHEYLSNFLTAQGRFDEGVREILKAEELDPTSPRAILMSAWTLYQARRNDEALAKARKAVAMQERLPQALLHLGNILTAVGEHEEAVEVLRQSAEGWGRSGLPRYMLAHARAAQGKTDAVRSILSKMLATREESYMKPFFLALAYVAAGDHDKAFEWLRISVDERNEWLCWLATEPKLDPLREDPRFIELLAATNNPIVRNAGQESSSGRTTGRERSIAVLPFQVIHGSEPSSYEDDYLSIGLADAVTMRLSNVRKFVVRPTSSVLQFAERETDPVKAGSELAVEFVVDGIVRHIGDRIRVTAQLLDVSENATIWSSSFSEKLSDVLELEDSISEQVTRSLLPQLTGEEQAVLAKRGTDNREAHDAYLQGRFFWNQFTPDSFPKAKAAFERAVILDPQYALAYVGLADYYTWAIIYGMLPPAENLERVHEAAKRAIELDPLLAEAHATLGLYHSNKQGWAASEDCYRKALELSPNYSLAHEWLSAILVGLGRFAEGVEEVLIAERLNMISLRAKTLSTWTIYQTRDFDQALSIANELLTLAPDFMQSHLQSANVLLEVGRVEEGLQHARRAVEIEPTSPLPVYMLCFALARAGLSDEAARLTAEFRSKAEQAYIPPYFLGMAEAASGNADAAIELFSECQQEYSPWAIWLGTEPKLDILRGQPRFQEVLEKAQLPILASNNSAR